MNKAGVLITLVLTWICIGFLFYHIGKADGMYETHKKEIKKLRNGG